MTATNRILPRLLLGAACLLCAAGGFLSAPPSAAAMGHEAAEGAVGSVTAPPVVPADTTDPPAYRLEIVADGLELPWGLAFLPDGDMLVTELPGRLRYVRQGALEPQPIAGVPEVYFRSQGGLMDVVLHPDFASNRLLYLTYAQGGARANALAVMRARLDGRRLVERKVIFTAAPRKDTPAHYGGRMVFLRDGSFLLTVGDGFDFREQAQNLANHFGTVVRLTDDGAPAPGNPFADEEAARPEIWSYGHRNAQAIVLDAQDRVWLHEHGARGGDELNLIQPGANYGWPLATFGLDYSGARVSPFTAYPNTQAPLVDWTPSIAPSGMTVYTGSLFADWQGDLFLTSLLDKNVVRVDMEDGKPQAQQVLFAELDARLRDIRTAPDGALYILTEGEPGSTRYNPQAPRGQIVRVTPLR